MTGEGKNEMLVLISHFELLHEVECLNLLETESAMKWGGDALVTMQEEHDFDWISNGKMLLIQLFKIIFCVTKE